MMTRIYSKLLFMLLTCILLIVGCGKDKESPVSNRGLVDVAVKAVTEQGTSSEDVINTLRLIVFKSDANGNVSNVIVNEQHTSNLPFELRVSEGYVRMFLFANEQTNWNLQKITSFDELKDKTIISPEKASLAPPFVMYADVVKYISTAQHDFTVEMERTVAKIKLDLTCNFASLGANITLQSVTLKKLPVTSFVVPQINNGGVGYFNGQTIPLTASSGNVICDNIGLSTKQGGLIFYMPENIISVATNYSYLEIVGNINNIQSQKLTYVIVLGDGTGKLYGANPVSLSSLSLKDLSITRNMYYKISATIENVVSKGLLIETSILRYK